MDELLLHLNDFVAPHKSVQLLQGTPVVAHGHGK